VSPGTRIINRINPARAPAPPGRRTFRCNSLLAAIFPLQLPLQFRCSRYGELVLNPLKKQGDSPDRTTFFRLLQSNFPGNSGIRTYGDHSDAGLLPYRELDGTLGLTDTGGNTLADARTGKNGRHRLAGLLRQSVFGRLAGYENVNDAERLCRDPAMRWVVGDRAITSSTASASQMGRFETKRLSRGENLAALADLPGQWIDRMHHRRPPKTIVLDTIRGDLRRPRRQRL
jgi:hypothetical protein